MLLTLGECPERTEQNIKGQEYGYIYSGIISKFGVDHIENHFDLKHEKMSYFISETG